MPEWAIRRADLQRPLLARIRWILLAPAAVLLAGCDLDLEKAFDLLTGRERNVVILASEPVMLRQQAMTLTSAEPMKVLGRDWTSLCFALQGGVALADVNAMDRAFQEAIRGAKLRVHVALDNGERIALGRPMQSWSMHGRILGRDELSACASAPCGTSLPVGSRVAEVEVSAEPALQVRGIYWRSEHGIGEQGASAPAGKTAEAPKDGASCSRQAL